MSESTTAIQCSCCQDDQVICFGISIQIVHRHSFEALQIKFSLLCKNLDQALMRSGLAEVCQASLPSRRIFFQRDEGQNLFEIVMRVRANPRKFLG